MAALPNVPPIQPFAIPGAYSKRINNGGSPNGLQGGILVGLVGQGDGQITTPSLSNFSGVRTALDNSNTPANPPFGFTPNPAIVLTQFGAGLTAANGGLTPFLADSLFTLTAAYLDPTGQSKIPAVETFVVANPSTPVPIITQGVLNFAIQIPIWSAIAAASLNVFIRVGGNQYSQTSLLCTIPVAIGVTTYSVEITTDVGTPFPTGLGSYTVNINGGGAGAPTETAAGAPPLFFYVVTAIAATEGQVVLNPALNLGPTGGILGETLPSNIVSLQTAFAGVPTSNSNAFDVTWSVVGGAVKYNVYRAQLIDPSQTPSFTVTNHLLVTLTGNQTNTFRDYITPLAVAPVVNPPVQGTAYALPFNTPTQFFSNAAVRTACGQATPIGLCSKVSDILGLSRILITTIDPTGIQALGPKPAYTSPAFPGWLTNTQAAKQISYQNAYLALQRVQVNVLAPADSYLVVITLGQQHCELMSDISERQERNLYAASLSTDESASPSGTHDSDFIGDPFTPNSIVFNATQVFNDRRVVVISPNTPLFTFVDASGIVQAASQQEGWLAAAATAIYKAVLGDPSEDLVGHTVSVFNGFRKTFLNSELQYLISNGVTPMNSVGGVQAWVSFVTTATNTAEDANPNIVLMDDVIISVLRSNLQPFIGRKITQQLLDAIFKMVGDTLNNFKKQAQLTQWDSLSVSQDPINPTFVDVQYAYTPMYSARVILITYAFDLRTLAAVSS